MYCTDSSVWGAINQCLAAPLVQKLGGLNANLDVKGSNISAGEKQLLCLARALLRQSKVSVILLYVRYMFQEKWDKKISIWFQIVVIDEGTSSLDSDSENAIQLILQNAFKSSTVLLIAHRLNGVQQTNRLLVIDDGQIVEDGNPQELTNDRESRFYALLEEQQATQTKS